MKTKEIEYYEKELEKISFGLLDKNNVYLKLKEEQLKLIIQNLQLLNEMTVKVPYENTNLDNTGDFWVSQLQKQINDIGI